MGELPWTLIAKSSPFVVLAGAISQFEWCDAAVLRMSILCSKLALYWLVVLVHKKADGGRNLTVCLKQALLWKSYFKDAT